MSFTLLELTQVQSRRIHSFEAYWRGKITGETIPQRRDIRPEELKPLLPWLMVVEIEAEPFRILYRLAGTKVVEMNRIELTGHYLDALDAGDGVNYTRQGMAAYRLAWSSSRPVYGSYRWPTPSGAEYLIEFAIFPVSEPGTDGQCVAIEDWEIDRKVSARRERPVPYAKAPPPKKRD